MMGSLWTDSPIGSTGLGQVALTRVAPGSSVGGPNLRRVAAILTLAFLAMVGTPGVGVAGSTLDGETFEWRGVGFTGNFACDFIAGTANVIEYQIFGGIADGPFTGDFREDGFISISTAGTWRGHFTVTDPATGAIVVEGSTSGSSTATCNSVNFGQSVSGAASATLTYTATIHAIGGGAFSTPPPPPRRHPAFIRGGGRGAGASFLEKLWGVDGFSLRGQVFYT